MKIFKIVKIYYDNFVKIKQKNNEFVKIYKQLKLFKNYIIQQFKNFFFKNDDFICFQIVNVLSFRYDQFSFLEFQIDVLNVE